MDAKTKALIEQSLLFKNQKVDYNYVVFFCGEILKINQKTIFRNKKEAFESLFWFLVSLKRFKYPMDVASFMHQNYSYYYGFYIMAINDVWISLKREEIFDFFWKSSDGILDDSRFLCYFRGAAPRSASRCKTEKEEKKGGGVTN